MKHVFTYGSLMFEPVWNRVVTGNYAKESATLRGFVRKAVHGEEYPVVYKVDDDPEAVVQGVVYLDVDAEDLHRLDLFEGEYYQRQTQDVQVGERTLQIEVYVLRLKYASIAADSPWDKERFEQEGLQKFMDLYVGFDR